MPNSERFPPALAHTAATMYYLQDVTQAEIAERLGTSRATVSRLLSRARDRGLVRIEVPPLILDEPDGLAVEVRDALGLEEVALCPATGPGHTTESISPVVSSLLGRVGLEPDDVLLVSSGRTVYEIAQRELPRLPGVLVVPVVGGVDEPEAWYQTNEITRQFAAGVGGMPKFLFAPAFPGYALRRSLFEDPEIGRFTTLWSRARCAVLGIGAPPRRRASLPSSIPADGTSLEGAVGDIATRFFDADGAELHYEGADRLVAIDFEALARVPIRIAVAHGPAKVPSIAAAAHGGHLTHLVTDESTARSLLDRHTT